MIVADCSRCRIGSEAEPGIMSKLFDYRGAYGLKLNADLCSMLGRSVDDTPFLRSSRIAHFPCGLNLGAWEGGSFTESCWIDRAEERGQAGRGNS